MKLFKNFNFRNRDKNYILENICFFGLNKWTVFMISTLLEKGKFVRKSNK